MKKLYNTHEEVLAARRRRRNKQHILKYKERYIERVPETGCWLWVGQCWSNGYGYVRYNGKAESAHRYIYRLYKGEFDPSLDMLHHCDVPSCVNPDHLFLGTHTDNMRDMHKKGRAASQKGTSNGNYKHGKYIKDIH
jgi:hypothetical protein